jgi:hypothetical protein
VFSGVFSVCGNKNNKISLFFPRANGGIIERTLRVLNPSISSFTGNYSTLEKTLFVFLLHLGETYNLQHRHQMIMYFEYLTIVNHV